MDAHQPVTLKEGDRYPLGPPNIRPKASHSVHSVCSNLGLFLLFRSSTAVVQLTVNQLVAGSIPASGASF